MPVNYPLLKLQDTPDVLIIDLPNGRRKIITVTTDGRCWETEWFSQFRSQPNKEL